MRDPHLRPCRGGGGWHPPKNLVPAGMFNSHPPHVWVVLLGPSARDASRGSQRYRGEVRLWANRPCPVCPAGLAPPTPCGQGCHQLQSPNHGDPRGARRVKSTRIGVGFPPAFRPPRPDLFLERCRAKNSPGAPVTVKKPLQRPLQSTGSDRRIFSSKVDPMSSKMSRRGPPQVLPIKSSPGSAESIKGGFGVLSCTPPRTRGSR